MKKSAKIFVASSCLLAGVGTLITMTTSFAATPYDQFSSNFSAAQTAQGNFEKVNNQAITNKEYQQFVAGQRLVDSLGMVATPSDLQLKEQFNLGVVLYQEAKEENLGVSIQDAQNYADKIREELNNPPSDANMQSLQQLKTVVQATEKALGITDDQYWNQVAPIAYQSAMSIGKLRDSQWIKYKASHVNASLNDFNAVFNKFGQSLLQNSTIQ